MTDRRPNYNHSGTCYWDEFGKEKIDRTQRTNEDSTGKEIKVLDVFEVNAIS